MFYHIYKKSQIFVEFIFVVFSSYLSVATVYAQPTTQVGYGIRPLWCGDTHTHIYICIVNVYN